MNKKTETDARRNTTMYVYDEAGRLNSVTAGFGTAHAQQTTYGYDDAGNRVLVVDANNHKTQSKFDARRRLVKTIYDDGTTTLYNYDGPGNLTIVTDQANNQVQYTYDFANQLKSVIQLASPKSAEHDGLRVRRGREPHQPERCQQPRHAERFRSAEPVEPGDISSWWTGADAHLRCARQSADVDGFQWQKDDVRLRYVEPPPQQDPGPEPGRAGRQLHLHAHGQARQHDRRQRPDQLHLRQPRPAKDESHHIARHAELHL